MGKVENLGKAPLRTEGFAGRVLEKLGRLPQAIEAYDAAQKLTRTKKWTDAAKSALQRLQHCRKESSRVVFFHRMAGQRQPSRVTLWGIFSPSFQAPWACWICASDLGRVGDRGMLCYWLAFTNKTMYQPPPQTPARCPCSGVDFKYSACTIKEVSSRRSIKIASRV